MGTNTYFFHIVAQEQQLSTYLEWVNADTLEHATDLVHQEFEQRNSTSYLILHAMKCPYVHGNQLVCTTTKVEEPQ